MSSDTDPTPWEWSLKGGSLTEWAPEVPTEEPTDDTTHTPIRTATVTATRTYTLGKLERTTQYTLITTLPNPKFPNA